MISRPSSVLILINCAIVMSVLISYWVNSSYVLVEMIGNVGCRGQGQFGDRTGTQSLVPH